MTEQVTSQMSVEQKRDVIKSHYPIGATIYPYDDTSAVVTGYKNWQSGCTLRILYDDGSRGTFPPEQGDRLFSPRNRPQVIDQQQEFNLR